MTVGGPWKLLGKEEEAFKPKVAYYRKPAKLSRDCKASEMSH